MVFQKFVSRDVVLRPVDLLLLESVTGSSEEVVFRFKTKKSSDSFERHTPHFAFPDRAGEEVQDLGAGNDRMSMTLWVDGFEESFAMAQNFYELCYLYQGLWEITHPMRGKFDVYITSVNRAENFLTNIGGAKLTVDFSRRRLVDEAFSPLEERNRLIASEQQLRAEYKLDAKGVTRKQDVQRALNLVTDVLYEEGLVREYVDETNDLVLDMLSEIGTVTAVIEELTDVINDPFILVGGVFRATGLFTVMLAGTGLIDAVGSLGNAIIDLFNRMTGRDVEVIGDRALAPIRRGDIDLFDAMLFGTGISVTRTLIDYKYANRREIRRGKRTLSRILNGYRQAADDIQLSRESLVEDGTTLLSDIVDGNTNYYHIVINYMVSGIRYLQAEEVSAGAVRTVKGNGYKSALQLYLEATEDINDINYDLFIEDNGLHGIDILSVPKDRELDL